MRLKQPLQILSPRSLEEAFEYLRADQPGALLAGGTDLIPLMRKDLKQPIRLIELSRIDSLGRIEERDGGLSLGAMLGLADLADSKLVREPYPALAAAAGMVASPQIRNTATLGGNLCQDRRCVYFNQSALWRQSLAPCFKTGGSVCHQMPSSSTCRAIYHSDLATVLLALQARVECWGDEGSYELPLAQFINQHVVRNGGIRANDRLLCGVIIPRRSPQAWSCFAKQGVRSAVDFALLNAALGWQSAGEGDARAKAAFYVGAVAAEPIELTETQELIEHGVGNRTEAVEAWSQSAQSEAKRKSALILDSGISVQARKKAFGLLRSMVEDLVRYLATKG